jgi:hypothetical protein
MLLVIFRGAMAWDRVRDPVVEKDIGETDAK